MCKSCVSDIAKTQMVLMLKTLGSGGGEERTDCDVSGRKSASRRQDVRRQTQLRLQPVTTEIMEVSMLCFGGGLCCLTASRGCGQDAVAWKASRWIVREFTYNTLSIIHI
jgi:hypothetical protein